MTRGAPEKWSASALFRKRGNRHIRGWAELATHCTLGDQGKTAAGALIRGVLDPTADHPLNRPALAQAGVGLPAFNYRSPRMVV
jgi:hypothetical protein